jgi:hypothetical protein
VFDSLNSPNLDQRLEAIRTLADASLSPADRVILIPRLIALLADAAAQVRAAAAHALGKLNATEAVRELKKLLDDSSPDVRRSAQEALNHLETAQTTESAPARQEAPAAPIPMPPQYAIPAVEVPVDPPSAPGGASVPRMREEAEPKPIEEVQFSVYYPREVVPEQWHTMTAYIFKSSAAQKVVEDAEQTLGGLMATIRRIVEAARHTIPEGTLITAAPYLQGFQFNPPHMTIGFYEDWHRLEFKLRSKDAPLHQAANGRMTFTVEGLIVADIPMSIYVGDRAGDMMTMTQKLYRAIFCSYSHDDAKIVERVERAYKILGFDFLRDVNALKSGQDWNEGLYKLIEQADIFQLFWSKSAADSEFVSREWQHALSLDRDEVNFIRPVYWENPMPEVPQALSHIHFAYEPTLDD